MAIPIPITPRTPESKSEIEQRLHDETVRHAAAILSGYELLQQLHEHGVLNMLRGAVGASDTIITKLAEAANTEISINAVRNLVSLSRILGSVDPEMLHRLADLVTEQKAAGKDTPSPGFWSAIRMFASKDSRRALGGAAAFLQAFGKSLAAAKQKA